MTGHATKSVEFSEKYQTASTPPPHFRKIVLQFFSKNVQKKALYKGPKSAIQIFGLKMTQKSIRFGSVTRPLK